MFQRFWVYPRQSAFIRGKNPSVITSKPVNEDAVQTFGNGMYQRDTELRKAISRAYPGDGSVLELREPLYAPHHSQP